MPHLTRRWLEASVPLPAAFYSYKPMFPALLATSTKTASIKQTWLRNVRGIRERESRSAYCDNCISVVECDVGCSESARCLDLKLHPQLT